MAQITIVGLGPGAPEHLTREAWDVLSTAGEVWLRTARHPVTAELPQGPVLRAFDDLYEQASTFEEVYATIVRQVLDLGHRETGVVYAVPGHPLVGEATVSRILKASREMAIPVRVVAGLSFIEPTLAALALDALDGVQIVDALDVAALHHPPLNPDMSTLIAQVYSRAVASELKLVLMNQYPDEHPTALVDAAGTKAESVTWLPLYEIDRQEVTPLTSLYVAPYMASSRYGAPPATSFEGLQETVARLRAPDGCPWDREQTHASLRANVLEETYEVLAAIDGDDPDALREELGDLLLQVALQTQIAVEEGEFQMADVIAGIDAKLKHRHPHVWGEVQVASAEDVCTNWEAIKRQEREANGTAERSLLDGVPKVLPALAQAYAYGSRAARVGFDWREIGGVIEKVQEEMGELARAGSPEEQTGELGDVLFAVANWARWLQVDPESALREANLRFARRFRHLESEARRRGVSLEQMSLEEMDDLWEEAKTRQA